MVTDALAQFSPSVTRTTTTREAFRQILPGGTPRRGQTCRVIYSAAQNASGANAVQFSMDISYDGGSTWQQEFFSDIINLTTTPKSDEIYIPYRVVANVMKVGAIAPQVALSCNISGAGSTPTITFIADHATGGPA